jgi:hypothetical protein
VVVLVLPIKVLLVEMVPEVQVKELEVEVLVLLVLTLQAELLEQVEQELHHLLQVLQ